MNIDQIVTRLISLPQTEQWIKENSAAGGEKQNIDKKFLKKYFHLYIRKIPKPLFEFLSEPDLAEFCLCRLKYMMEISDSGKGKAFSFAKSRFIQNPTEIWLTNMNLIEIVIPDAPFLKDSLLEFIQNKGWQIQNLIHHIVYVKRQKGVMVDIADKAEYEEISQKEKDPEELSKYKLEFWALFFLESKSDARRQVIEKEISGILQDIYYVTNDFKSMVETLAALKNGATSNLFIDWLIHDNFVFLGVKTNKKELGIYRRKGFEDELGIGDEELSAKEAKVIKTELISDINRRENITVIILPNAIIVGTFTRKAKSTSSGSVPILEQRLTKLKRQFENYWTTHDISDFIYTFNLFPLDDRLHYPIRQFIPFHDLVNEARLNVKGLAKLHSLGDERAYLLLLWPIEEYSDEISKKVDFMLKTDNIEILRKSDHVLSSLIFMLYEIKPPEVLHKRIKNPEKAALWEIEILDSLLSWDKKIEYLIKTHYSKEKTEAFLQDIIPAFPDEYKSRNTIGESQRDIEILESLRERPKSIEGYILNNYSLKSELRRSQKKGGGGKEKATGEAFLKFYLKSAYTLSFLVPILSNFGLNVLEEESYQLKVHGEAVNLYKFHISYPEGSLSDDQLKRLTHALELIIDSKASSEPMNALILTTPLTIYQIELLKALVAYLVQVRKGFSRVSIKRVLTIRPLLAVALVDQFLVRFLPPMIERIKGDRQLSERVRHMIPDFPEKGEGIESYIGEKKRGSMKVQLETLLQNETYGGIKAVIGSIIRTNFFAMNETISFKIRPDLITFAPQPHPMYEIWVHHSNFEGVHLRGGPVARGGLRWSSRADDFRTEVWGLWKTQVLKNSIIVPTGAKGGFVIKYRANDVNNAIWAYRLFITSLLEITDDRDTFLQDGEIPIPCLDQPDPYLVVAADKGTATFSDYANEIATQKGFWLGDAFASGGKYGYSHKDLGITAKGAWESARWHFYQMGIDPEKDPVTVAAIGDMGGDVFGNGMILSSSILLVAAFNHKHIFLDPNPDPKVSYKERVRLFEKVGGWDQYNPSLISKGGGVYSREAISIQLSAAVQKAIGTNASALSGEQLIRAILSSPVDMIFNGGIGTYIKSAHEDHHDVDDHANDNVRVDAHEVRAKVVVEGGNLGVSPRGRLEYALQGGLINTDAVDNSAGVDLSDHEVNLKILLGHKSLHKKMDIAQRNKVVEGAAEEEVELVLWNNFRQNWSIVHQAHKEKREQELSLRFYQSLLDKGVINKKNEELPKIAELNKALEENGVLPRPFISNLLGYARIYCRRGYNKLPAKFSQGALFSYFPKSLQKFGAQIKSHPLAKEIISMSLINEAVDQAGISYLFRCESYLGLTPSEAIDAYLHTKENMAAQLVKLRRLLPNCEKRQFPAEIDFNQMILSKERFEKSIYRYIEMGALFKDKIPGWKSGAPLRPLDLKNNHTLYIGVPYLDKLPQDVRDDMVQIFHVELRYILQYVMPRISKKDEEGFIDFYHTAGIRTLKREIYRVWPQNYWEIQSMLSIKRNFWKGLTKSYLKFGPSKKGLGIDIDLEISKLKEENKLNISALSGLVGFLFSS